MNKKEALRLFEKFIDDIVLSQQGKNLLHELKIADILNHQYVDSHGYDGIDKDGKKYEYKACDSRTANRAQWSSCGSNKSNSDYFIFWDVLTNMAAKVPTKEVQKHHQGGQIKAYLSDSSNKGRSSNILTISSWFKNNLEGLNKNQYA